MIEIRNVYKDYKTKKSTYRALSDICLSFPDVQFVSILGPSGCGKTTLLNLIGCLDRPTAGDILVDGRSLRRQTEKEADAYRNGSIGFVFQDCFLIPQLTVLDNVKMGLLVRGYSEKESEERARKTMERIGIEDLAPKKPNELSGGQGQRVAICRALATDPKILLCDEPTGALDSVNSEGVLQILKECSRDRLVLVVTHNEELAEKYSDRIVRLKDGRVLDDSGKGPSSSSSFEQEKKTQKRSRLPFKTMIRLAVKNLIGKGGKTALTCVANAFGMVGIGFFLALNNGFDIYSQQISRVTASSLPIVVTSYSTVSDSESYGDVNADVLYPDVDEIYPTVSVDTEVSYVYNNFTDKYFRFLDKLVEDGLATEYVVNYGNDYAMNLTTTFPASIDETTEATIGLVSTTRTSSSSIASLTRLPNNIFHSLYGSLDDYDVIEGTLPKNENELVLVVDEYNSIDFDILKDLGFYSKKDTEDDVKTPGEAVPVRPISFSDIIGKKYKIYDNDDYYFANRAGTITDGFGNTRTATLYNTTDIESKFEDPSIGKTLTITGILRPKEGSSYGLLSPSLCFLPELQKGMVDENANSDLSRTIQNNVVFSPEGTAGSYQDLLSELSEQVEAFEESDGTVFPTQAVRNILDRYFCYYDFKTGNAYTLSSLVNQASTLGIDLVPESMKALSLSDTDQITALLEDVQGDILSQDYDSFYQLAIGLCAYVNAFSLIDSVTIIPTDLSLRSAILERLDSFNDIQSGSDDHASDVSEQVHYSSINDSAALEEVGQVIDMSSVILLVFAAISLIVSCAMTAIMTTNNVLERKREIGLLRALGSRKMDILGLFETEALLVGFLTGLVGCLATYVLTFPVNSLIDNTFPYYQVHQIARFTFPHALVILAIAVAVSFLSALVPSLKAAKKDPVVCLRDE